MLSEQQIEKRLIKKVKEFGGKALKFISPGLRGVPDRIVLLPGARIYFVELKRPGEKLMPQQEKRRDELISLGFKHYELDSYEAVEVFINEVCKTQ